MLLLSQHFNIPADRAGYSNYTFIWFYKKLFYKKLSLDIGKNLRKSSENSEAEKTDTNKKLKKMLRLIYKANYYFWDQLSEKYQILDQNSRDFSPNSVFDTKV